MGVNWAPQDLHWLFFVALATLMLHTLVSLGALGSLGPEVFLGLMTPAEGSLSGPTVECFFIGPWAPWVNVVNGGKATAP